jgi:hypothetical protein
LLTVVVLAGAILDAMTRALPSGFLAGVNLPWLDYGCDFGANAWQPEGGLARPERRARLRPVLARLADQGIRLLRWFWLCDGRAGLRVSGDGDPEGLDARVVPDLESSLELAAEHGLQVMPVLLSFDWLGRPQWVDGVQLRGRARMVSDAARRAHLVDRVFAPLLERFGRSPAVFAWDLMNEPEWTARRVGRAAMRAFLDELRQAAQARVSQPVTVGLASVAGLRLVEGLDLDFHQVHWYDSLGRARAPHRPVARLGLDRPLVLGEFPSRASAFATEDLLEAARRAGYAGAFAWSVLADDPVSAGPACAAAVAGWMQAHGTEGPLLA